MSTDKPDDDLEWSLGSSIGAMSRQVWQWVRCVMHDEVRSAGFTDLNPAHLMVFRYPAPDGLAPTELAEQMQITKQSVNELLGHLERAGYLVRDLDPEDSRRRRIRLTARGRQVQQAVSSGAQRAERRAAELLGPERLHNLHRDLAEVVALIEAGRLAPVAT
jgi:DNA-binding MarR family transcriptional regulator